MSRVIRIYTCLACKRIIGFIFDTAVCGCDNNN